MLLTNFGAYARAAAAGGSQRGAPGERVADLGGGVGHAAVWKIQLWETMEKLRICEARLLPSLALTSLAPLASETERGAVSRAARKKVANIPPKAAVFRFIYEEKTIADLALMGTIIYFYGSHDNVQICLLLFGETKEIIFWQTQGRKKTFLSSFLKKKYFYLIFLQS